MFDGTRTKSSRWTLWFIAFILCVIAAAQGAWSLGPYTWMMGPPSAPLQVNLADAGGLQSYGFVSRVGGVAFAQVARPAETFPEGRIRLRYRKDAPDASHLSVQTGEGDPFNAPIPDWLLLPIARFADSRFDSCVSLFGPKTTATVYDVVYHTAFQDTLLGVRLLQADMLLFNLAETWRLPALGSSIPLGFGETAPTALDRDAATRIQSVVRQATFQSWVMTDEGVDVHFDATDGTLRLSGEPYYYFWTSDSRDIQAQQQELRRQAAEAEAAGNISRRNQLVRKHNDLKPTVIPVTAITNGLKPLYQDLRRFNPAVYEAARTTLRYSAFFRYVRTKEPNEWKIFLKELEAGAEVPPVATPTKWAR